MIDPSIHPSIHASPYHVQVFIYNGNFDMVCGSLGVETMYYQLQWAGQKAWQSASRQIWQSPIDNHGNLMYSGCMCGEDSCRNAWIQIKLCFVTTMYSCALLSSDVRQLEGFNVTQIIVAGAGHLVF
jgi:hypothetical protein